MSRAIAQQSPSQDDRAVAVSGAFTTQQAARLSGLSARQLAYWDRTDVFAPSLSRGARRPFGRIYSFQDVVALRTLARLRKRFSLERLRTLGGWLKQQYDHPWSRIRFYVRGDDIIYVDPDTQALVTDRPLGQGALAIQLEPIAAEVEAALRVMRQRDPHDIGAIERHRYVMRNEWVIAGTRIPVWSIHELAHAGYDEDAILAEYPILARDDVRAALRFDPDTTAERAS